MQANLTASCERRMPILCRRSLSWLSSVCERRQAAPCRTPRSGEAEHGGSSPLPWEFAMLDLILVVVGLGCFALLGAYAVGCERV
jgi:hypothetical protein